ncbi:glutamate--tRNA ligase [Chloroflexota bacterium]
MTEKVRTRFAPSPTGLPHVGNIRTAMFAWLMAKHFGGSFVLRIEDTDVARTVPGAMETIMDGLCWLGLDWDEGPGKGGDVGPYLQSERLGLYQAAAERLVAQGDAYYCYCTPERLTEMRTAQVAHKQPPGYDRRCRHLTEEQRAELAKSGVTPVVRFAIPREGKTEFTDLIYGDLSFENANIDDFVILKSDGYPTYHLASVADDSAMQISHVIRAEEWISSTPRHLMIYRALGLTPPKFIHHPMILGPDKAKLSKRHGSVSILEYREMGYLPETMFNFLALIGWSLDDKTELMTCEEMIRFFSLDRIGKTGAVFNRDKLDWMNGVYIRGLSVAELTERALPFLEKGLPQSIPRPLDRAEIEGMIPLVQERAKTLVELPELIDFFFGDEVEYETPLLIVKKMEKASALAALTATLAAVEPQTEFTEESLEPVMRVLAETLQIKTGQLFGTVRVAVTGKTATPPLFETMVVLGREKCLRRLKAAIAKLEAYSG